MAGDLLGGQSLGETVRLTGREIDQIGIPDRATVRAQRRREGMDLRLGGRRGVSYCRAVGRGFHAPAGH
jgi:hypothetical protein